VASITDLICARTDEEREVARTALQKRNAEAPSDREVLATFLKSCVTMDGAPLTLDDAGAVVTLQ
jgi:hypothetical protein